MTGARIAGLGAYRPARVVDNDELARSVDTSDEWVRRRTGIATRHRAGAGESVVEMAAAASGKALAAAGVDAADVDLVLLATCTMPTSVPGGAASVATSLGARRAGALDLNAACAGFCYGLALAASSVRDGTARHVLVIGAERLSDWVDWADRATCVLFGDGAGAAVVTATADDAIGPVVWGSDGTSASLIEVPAAGPPYIRMDGSAVFRWATAAMADVARAACAAADVEPSELAAFVPHQANLRIVEAVSRAIGVPDERVSRDVVDSGNTSSASVPLALSRLVDEGRVAAGGPVLLLGFGAGLTYAAQVVRCP